MTSMKIKADACGRIYRPNYTGFASHSSPRCFVQGVKSWSEHEILQGPKNSSSPSTSGLIKLRDHLYQLNLKRKK